MAVRPAIPGPPARTYATRENAVKAISQACERLAVEISYLVCQTEEGRHYPVVLPSENQMQIALYLAQKGFMTVRT
jgi:hypothetical protein